MSPAFDTCASSGRQVTRTRVEAISCATAAFEAIGNRPWRCMRTPAASIPA